MIESAIVIETSGRQEEIAVCGPRPVRDNVVVGVNEGTKVVVLCVCSEVDTLWRNGLHSLSRSLLGRGNNVKVSKPHTTCI